MDAAGEVEYWPTILKVWTELKTWMGAEDADVSAKEWDMAWCLDTALDSYRNWDLAVRSTALPVTINPELDRVIIGMLQKAKLEEVSVDVNANVRSVSILLGTFAQVPGCLPGGERPERHLQGRTLPVQRSVHSVIEQVCDGRGCHVKVLGRTALHQRRQHWRSPVSEERSASARAEL